MNTVSAILLRREAGISVMIVLFCLAVGAAKPHFLTLDSLRIVLLLVPLIMIGAMGEMLVIVARHVDLSIGSILGLTAMASGMMFRYHPEIWWPLGFVVSVGVGALLGVFNGLLVTLFRLPAIIVTLGTLNLFRGMTFIMSNAKQIDRQYVPTPLKAMSQTSPFFDIPWIIIMSFGVALLTYWLAMHTRIGRQIYALGSNPVAAPLRGIPVTAVTLLVFTISGALAGLAGIMYASRWGFVNPSNTGSGFEFQVIAAVVIGGVSINGGVGTVLGTVLGVLLLGCVAAALPLLGIPGTTQSAIYGAVILVALLIDRLVRQRGIQTLTRREAAHEHDSSRYQLVAPIALDAAAPRPTWQVILIRPESMTFLLLIGGIIIGSQLSEYFLDINYILKSFTLSAEFAIVALVLTMVIIAGEIDLSPAANMALSACLFAYAQEAGIPMPIAILIGLGSGMVMGALNGLMVIGLKLPSIIVTIGTLTLYRGLAQVIAGDKSIRVPEWFIGIDNVLVFGVPVPVIAFVALSIVLGLVLGATIFGRQIYQIGTNEIAARHAGIRSRRIKMILFVVTGLTSAVAGLMTASRLGSVRYDLGLGGELQMVLMAMLGGTYIFGGRGTILGTFLAAWLLVIVTTGMIVADWLPAYQLCVLGVLLIVSIIATNLIYSRTER